MRIFIEVFVFYLLFFASGMFPRPPAGAVSFSLTRELVRLCAYTLPGIGVIGIMSRPIPAPRVRDIVLFPLSMAGLILIGLGVSGIASLAGYPAPVPQTAAPEGFSEWAVLGASCLGTGYLEEGFFRFCLIRRLETAGLRRRTALFIAVLLFGACHLYEGPWGILNALLGGLSLSLVAVNTNTIHGLAWAHAGYNAFVYFWLKLHT